MTKVPKSLLDELAALYDIGEMGPDDVSPEMLAEKAHIGIEAARAKLRREEASGHLSRKKVIGPRGRPMIVWYRKV